MRLIRAGHPAGQLGRPLTASQNLFAWLTHHGRGRGSEEDPRLLSPQPLPQRLADSPWHILEDTPVLSTS